ncbi:hypothetical protein U9M48_010880, partial [Paspalum notatum var. saurae]
ALSVQFHSARPFPLPRLPDQFQWAPAAPPSSRGRRLLISSAVIIIGQETDAAASASAAVLLPLPMAPPLALLLLAALSLALTLCPSPAVSHAHGGGGGFYDPARVTQLSWRPRAFLYSGFLSDGECDHIVNLAKGSMEKSMVADNESGKSVMSQVRTSSGTFLAKHQVMILRRGLLIVVDFHRLMSNPVNESTDVLFFDPLKDETVSAIEKRVAAWTFLPEENAESMQVLHYEIGQKYDAHFDYFHDKNNLKRGGHRIATVLMYLTDVKKGGETVFPNAVGSHLQYKDETWSECARSGLAVKPKKGDALLFFSLHVNATTDTSSLHGSCPVIEGEKWSATKWIHVSFTHAVLFFSPLQHAEGDVAAAVVVPAPRDVAAAVSIRHRKMAVRGGKGDDAEVRGWLGRRRAAEPPREAGAAGPPPEAGTTASNGSERRGRRGRLGREAGHCEHSARPPPLAPAALLVHAARAALARHHSAVPHRREDGGRAGGETGGHGAQLGAGERRTARRRGERPTGQARKTDATASAVLLQFGRSPGAIALALFQNPAVSHAQGGGGSEGGFYDPARVTQLSWRPSRRLGFVAARETLTELPFVSHLLGCGGVQAKGSMEKSMVADNDSGQSVMSQVHTSSATFLTKRQIYIFGWRDLSNGHLNAVYRAANESTDALFFDPWKDETVSAIEKRVAAWTFLPEENAEPIQTIGQKYVAHFDNFHDKNNLKRGGHRSATVLMYLTDVKKGGETVFPNAEGSHSQYKDETWSECARSVLAVKPKKGDTLLFFSLHVNAATDTSSLHGSCPVIEGDKWSATKWFHVRSFDNPPNVKMDAPCSDDKLCPKWAAIGECHKNPTYMVGTKDTPGFCRKSCGLCLLLFI